MKKKPPRALSLVLALALSLAACGTGAAPQPQGDTVPLTALNAQKEPAEVAVPYDPQRIAVLDMATLDILDALGVGGRVVGAADTRLDYLQTTSAARCPAWAQSKRPAWRPSWPVAPT